MKRVLRVTRAVVKHMLNVLALMLITFYIIDRHNSAMEFIDNDMTKALIFIFAVLTIIYTLLTTYRAKTEREDARQNTETVEIYMPTVEIAENKKK